MEFFAGARRRARSAVRAGERRAARPARAPAGRLPLERLGTSGSAGTLGARALLFASAVFFGLSAVLVRVATLGGMSGGQVTLVRFAFGLAAVVVVFRARPGTFRPAHYGLLAARGAFGGLAAVLYFMSIQRIPAGEATLLNNTFPIWAVLLSIVLLGERPTFHLAAALAVASAGVFLVLGGGETAFRLGPGEALGIASAVFGGAAVTAIRALRGSANVPAPTVFLSFSIGGALAGVPFAFGPWPSAPGVWLAAVGVGVTSFVAQLAMTEAYGQLSVPEAAIWQQLTPVASYLWAFGVGERVSAATAVGVLLGLAGVAYGSVLGHRATETTSPAARAAPAIPSEEP